MFRNRMLGGVSFLPFYRPDDGAGAGGAGGAGAGGSGSGAGTGAGAGDGGKGGAAGKDQAGGGGAAGDSAADKTLAGGGAAGADAAAAAAAAAAAGPAKFPTTWREELAGGDAQKLKDLQKYASPDALYGSLRDVQTKISKGELRAPPAALAKDATPEQIAAYRTANNLPDKPDAYVEKLALPDGIVLGETDKPLVGDFAKMALDKGWSQGQFNDAVGWFYEAQQAQEAQRVEADGVARVASEVELRTEWGPDFKPNMNAVGSVLAMMPAELKNELLGARTAAGQLVGNTAAFNRWAASLGREINPAATLIPVGDVNAAKTVGEELKTIEGKMYLPDGRNNPEYWRDEKMQARYRELTDAQQKMAAKGSRAA